MTHPTTFGTMLAIALIAIPGLATPAAAESGWDQIQYGVAYAVVGAIGVGFCGFHKVMNTVDNAHPTCQL